jgi:hypothetical protein
MLTLMLMLMLMLMLKCLAGTFRTGLSISVILTRLAIMGVYSLTARCDAL